MKKVAKFLKHLFIPHIGNDFKPHFFREVSVFSILVITVALLAISLGTNLYIKNTNMTATVLPAVLVDLTNSARLSNNELALARNPLLDTAAKLKAENMASLGYFAHTSPTGVTPWYWFSQAGYSFVYAGENLAVDFTESADVERAWLDSPTHKKNILNTNFTDIGIATAEGIYQGRQTTFVVQMFGTPAFMPKTETVEAIPAPSAKVAVLPKEEKVIPEIPAEPEVKGESVATNENLETITDTKEFVVVKNTEAVKGVSEVAPNPVLKYSAWYQKFLFKMPRYTDTIYHIFIWLVLVALILMMGIEIKCQHPKNIMYGILILVIILSFIYLNRSMFMVDLFI
jgi:hypothetical protein